jgi:hypothetical protein
MSVLGPAPVQFVSWAHDDGLLNETVRICQYLLSRWWRRARDTLPWPDRLQAMKERWGVETWLLSFSASALDGGERSDFHPGRFNPAKQSEASSTRWVGNWVGSSFGLDILLKTQVSCYCRESNHDILLQTQVSCSCRESNHDILLQTHVSCCCRESNHDILLQAHVSCCCRESNHDL